MNRYLALGFAVAALFLIFLSFAFGAAFAAHSPGEDLNRVVLPVLSIAAGWVSGIGTFVAAVVALHIAGAQSEEVRAHDAVRCIHHAMAVVNDLRSRLHYFESTVTEGGRPLAALTRNADAIARRYESLFDRDLYRHLPGPVVDSITAMSGTFFALEAWVAAQTSALEGKLHAVLPVREQPGSKNIDAVRTLVGELDALFGELEKVAAGGRT